MIVSFNPKKILILAANPKQTVRLRLDEEVRDIREGLRLAQKRELFTIEQEWAVRPRDIRRAILNYRPNIIHFSGHGSGSKGLSFEDETGQEKLVTTEALKGLFKECAKYVECVLLNACYSESQADEIVQHINYVIGMKDSIGDRAAIEFAVGFYDALAAYDSEYDEGTPTEYAFNMACNAIQLAGVSGDSIPILKKNQSPITKKAFSNKFQQRIDEKTKDFVGREYVFDAIAQFISSHPKGYFTITGDPGMGKSAILSQYTKNTGCICHFNIQGECESSDEFIKSIYTELIQRYQLSSRTIPDDSRKYASFLSELLEEVANKRNGKPVVIAIDALDEVDKSNLKSGSNILSLPISLPDGVYIVMTKRRDVKVPFRTEAPNKIFKLLDCQEQSRGDICKYIKKRIQRSEELQKWEVEIPDFVEKMADKSQNNFMYLVFVLNDIEEGVFFDFNLDSVPTGLEQYYEWHWERMGMNVEPLPEVKLKVVYYLAAAREPITLSWLGNRLPKQNPNTLLNVLTQWSQFLHKKLENKQRKYSIYHASFRDFLYSQETLDGVKMSVEGVHSQIVSSFTKGFFEDE